MGFRTEGRACLVSETSDKLDGSVDAAYARRKFSGDSDRLAFLFELYQQIISPLVAKKNLLRKKPKRHGSKSGPV
ncbi:MAG: hypothetical protein HY790_11605 [Deltaproteobacteria bacterium]|nr:hypothetical protein [Deltaproteobacteria bacterium]